MFAFCIIYRLELHAFQTRTVIYNTHTNRGEFIFIFYFFYYFFYAMNLVLTAEDFYATANNNAIRGEKIKKQTSRIYS